MAIETLPEDEMQPLDIDGRADDTEGDELADMPTLSFLRFVTEGGNLVEYLDEGALNDIALDVDERYKLDKESMHEWFDIMQKGLDLAKMVKKDKSYPFEGASNVHYPLVTSAALQYNARAYPAIVPSGDPVHCKVHGEDPDGMKASRAERVSDYASFQLKTRMRRWEKDTDSITFIGPIVGTMFRKYWYDPALQSTKSRICQPGTVIVNNSITDLSEAPAITEEFDLYLFDIESRRRTGWFVDEEVDGEDTIDRQKPQEFIEQICRIDLDDDGYEEPYIVTMHKNSSKIMRIAAAFDLDDVRLGEVDEESREATILAIEPNSFYVDYHFLPSFDGSFMGHGLGALLGDISSTVNTMLNMLVDSGHYSMMGGGFIGAKDFRVKGAQARFEPGEWKHVNFHGGDIKNGIVPMSFPQPSPVMFQLLGMMVDAGRELSSTSNIMTGDAANANMPVGTVMALVEQGMQVFTASYKRIYRSLKTEFELLCRLNARYLPPQTYAEFFNVQGGEQPNPQADFDLRDMDITPVADPKSVTDMQKMAKAEFLLGLARDGLVDRAEAITRVLRAASIDDIDALIPQPNPMDAAIAEAQMYSAQLDLQMKSVEIEKKMAETQSELAKAAKDVASAESEEMGRQLQSYLAELNVMKEALNVRRQQLDGMAGSSGDGTPVQSPQQATQPIQGPGASGVLGGQPNSGGRVQ